MKFKSDFAYNYELSVKHFDRAIAQIENSIKAMENTKEALTKTQYQLGLAHKKSQKITIKKLTASSPTMRKKFDELPSVSVNVIEDED